MPVTIQIRFQDDAGHWHEFITVPEAGFDTVPMEDSVEYRIRPAAHLPLELSEMVDMTGHRTWQFTWFKGGSSAGLSVRRRMEFTTVADGVLKLRTADAAGRNPAS